DGRAARRKPRPDPVLCVRQEKRAPAMPGEIVESSQRAIFPAKNAIVEVAEPECPVGISRQGDGSFEIDARRRRDRSQPAVGEPPGGAWCDPPERAGAIRVEPDGAVYGKRLRTPAGKLIQPMTCRDPDASIWR